MKILTSLLLLISYLGIGQTDKLSKASGQSSAIEIKGNNNIVKVIQGAKLNVYNLKDDIQFQKFVEYLQTIPTMNKYLSKILQYNKKILAIVTKLDEDGILDKAKSNEAMEKYIRENERLKIENQNLIKEGKNNDFVQVLENANKKLENFDNEGYQQVIEDYKIEKKKKINQSHLEFGTASYLQAKNNYNNNYFGKALEQINEALDYDKENINFIFLKAEIFHNLLRYDECIDAFNKVILIGKPDSMLLMSYNEIGLIYNEKGEFDKALENFHVGLSILSETPDTDNLNLIISFNNNIGFVLINKEDYDKALYYLNKSLELQSGNEVLYNNLGLVYDAKGDYIKALEYYHKTLAIQEKTLSKDHPLTAITYNNLGGVYQHTMDYKESMEFYTKALIIFERVYGSQHPKTGTCYNNIGSINMKIYNYNEAFKFYNKALIIFENLYGKENKQTAICYNNLAAVYDVKGNYDKALEFYFKSLSVKVKVLFKESPTVADSYNNIGLVYYHKSEYNRACDFYYKSLNIREKILGKDNSNTKDSYQNLGAVLISKGDMVKGVDYLEKTGFRNLSGYEKSIYFVNFAGVKYGEKKFVESIFILNLALNFLQQSNRTNTDTLWAEIYQNMAMAYCDDGKKDSAIILFEKAILSCKENRNVKLLKLINHNYNECKQIKAYLKRN